MKQMLQLLGTAFLFALATTNVNAQCFIYQDTVIAGDGLGNYTIYIRDIDQKLLETQRIDYSFPGNSVRDTAFYNPDGSLWKVETYFILGGNLKSGMELIYDLDPKVTRILEWGDNGSPWTKAFDLTYNGSMELTDMTLDLGAVTGSPEGMLASFLNMTHSGGNIIYVDLVGDFGFGPDIYEVDVNYDTKPNYEGQLMLLEAPGFLTFFGTNNLLNITLVNDEMIGMAGEKAIDRVFTYDGNDKVVTMQEYPSIFESDALITRYDWDCSLGLEEIMPTLEVYPNPVKDVLTIKSEDYLQSYELYNMNGQLIKSGDISNNTIDFSEVDNGAYLLQLGGQTPVKIMKL